MKYPTDVKEFILNQLKTENNQAKIARCVLNTFDMDTNMENVRKYVSRLCSHAGIKTITKMADESHEECSDSASSSALDDHPLTEAEMAKKWDIDLKIWQSKKLVTNKWGDQFQTKITWELIKDEVNFKDLLDDFIEKAKAHAPVKATWKPAQKSKGGYLAEFPVFDWHFGRQSWGKSTGADYDSKIAKDRLFEAFADLTEKTKCFKVEQVLLTLGGDILNHDTVQGTTSSGLTPQDSDSRIHKLLSEAIDVFVEVIDNLLTIAPVHIISVSGNHDDITSYALTEVIRVWYRNNNQVTIDSSPKLRKYYAFGSNLLGITHGNMSAKAIRELPMIMAAETSLWSESKYREFQYGHLHSTKNVSYIAGEDQYCMTRRMPSLASPCQWTYANGFIGSQQKQNALIFHKEQGLVAVFDSIAF